MAFLNKEDFLALAEAEQEQALTDLAGVLGKELTVNEDDELVDIYLANLPEQDDSKAWVTPKESVRFKDDDGNTRTLLKGQKALVGAKVAEQMRDEGLVS
ncbi:MAG: hypothetical protein CMH98_04690 [Oceanospirillaceae bacterium]|nr:hypothetical protein [Oceanospirillaceae bacterium]